MSDLQRDWLKINKMCQDIRWMSWGDHPEKEELLKVLEGLMKIKDRIKVLIEDD